MVPLDSRGLKGKITEKISHSLAMQFSIVSQALIFVSFSPRSVRFELPPAFSFRMETRAGEMGASWPGE